MVKITGFVWLMFVTVAIVVTTTYFWINKRKLLEEIKLNNAANRVKSTAKSAWGRVENAAKVAVSNLAHTESNPEPINGN
jgi:hypothetical protein